MGRKQKQYHFIYKTTNLINEKFYVGMHSTDNLNDGYIGSGKKLSYSVKKYGKENFKCEILEFFNDRNSLKDREKELINEDLLKEPLCMNLKTGGDGGGKIWNEVHKRNFRKGASNYLKNKWKDNDYREKISKVLRNNTKESHKLGKIKYDTFKGKKHKIESIKKMKGHDRQLGEKNSQFGTCWVTNGIENKKIKKENIVPNGWYKGRTIK